METRWNASTLGKEDPMGGSLKPLQTETQVETHEGEDRQSLASGNK